MHAKMKKISLGKEAKASLVFVFASVCSQGMAIISLPFFTRLLTTEQMGVVTTYNTWLNLIGMVSTLGLTSGSFNIAMMKYGEARAQYTSSALTLSLIPSSALMLLSIPFGEFFSACLGLSVPLIRCMCLMLMLSPALNLWLMRQRYEYRYISVFSVTVLNSVIGTLLAVVAVLVASSSRAEQLPEIRVISSACVTAVVAVLLAIMIFATGRTFYSRKYWGFAIKTGAPLIVHSMAKYILDASDRILIGYYVGAAAVGIYGVLYSLSSVSLVFWSAINSALVPFIFERLKDGEGEKVRSIATPLLVAYAAVSILLMLLAPEIVQLLATESYGEAVYLVPPIATGIFFTSLYNLYSNLILYKERTAYVMLATVVAAVFNVAANVILLPIFGYIAAAYVTLASCCLLSVMQYAFSKKLGVSRIYNDRFNLLLSLGVVIAGIVVNVSYEWPSMLRHAAIIVLIALCLVFRKRLLGAYKVIKS